jgi:hypothetical protein
MPEVVVGVGQAGTLAIPNLDCGVVVADIWDGSIVKFLKLSLSGNSGDGSPQRKLIFYDNA